MRPIMASLVLLALLQLMSAPALAAEEIAIAHEETVTVGPYTMVVGFSEWPARVDRSMDIVFMPRGGIEDKRGRVVLIAPDGQEYQRWHRVPDDEHRQLVRHPRQRTVWGLDVIALPAEGDWTFRFEIDGPLGHGVGELPAVRLAERPGPPLALSWLIGVLPLLGLVGLIHLAWRRVQPSQQPEARQWT